MLLDDLQIKIWDILEQLDGDTVTRLFTGYHGTRLLDEGFLEYLEDEGYESEE